METLNWINTLTHINARKIHKTVLLICAALMCFYTSLHGETYFNKSASFSITLPSDWIQISKDSLKNIFDIKKAPYNIFDFLYKTKDARPFIDYPYMLIQVSRPGPYSERKSLADLADWKLEKITRSYLLTMDDKFYLERSTGRLWQKTNIGNMTRISLFFPTKHLLYNIFFYSKKEDLPRYLPVLFGILTSFKEEKPELLVLNFDKSKAAYSIIAVFIGLVAFISFQRYPKTKK